MDDTPARMRGRDELASRSAEEMVGRRIDAPGGTEAFEPTASPQSRGPDGDEASWRTRQIRAEIEQTREEMSETIEAIQQRIRPATLASDAAERIRHSAKEKVTSMAHMAGRRAHAMMNRADDLSARSRGGGQQAIPIALIGLGAAWMLMNRSRSRQRPYDADWRYDDRPGGETGGAGRQYLSRSDLENYGAYGDTEIYGGGGYREYSRESGWSSGLWERIADNPIPAALTSAGLAWLAFSEGRDEGDGEWYDSQDLYRGSMGSYADTTGREHEESSGGASSSAMDMGRDAVSRAQEGTRHLAERAQKYVKGTRRRIKSRSRGARHEVQHLAQSNPLVVGAAAFMLGAAVGLVIPETDREHEWMGGTRDRMFERAQERARDMAQNTVAEVKHAAGDALANIASEVVGASSQQDTGKSADRRNS